jgi:geranylgeranyl diphosphate synthase type II
MVLYGIKFCFIGSILNRKSMQLTDYLNQRQALINQYLARCIPPEDQYPQTIHKAMRYSLFAGGKRLRPILAMAAAEAVGSRAENVLPVAGAVELVHTYSMIHDDLPAMDNDDLRRGQPTSHKVFGEAIAILAGDALLTMAFELLTDPSFTSAISYGQYLEIIGELALAAGSRGLIGGQVADIESEGKQVDFPLLEYIHTHKTGSLILASVKMGGLAANCSSSHLGALSAYGERVGLAYQIIDDILDVEGKSTELGKNTGGDVSLGKATYPALWGMKQAKEQAQNLITSAQQELSPLGESANRLREIAQFIISRNS